MADVVYAVFVIAVLSISAYQLGYHDGWRKWKGGYKWHG
jgi:hypothetical protein